MTGTLTLPPTLERRLEHLTGGPADDHFEGLRRLVGEAEDSPAFELMATICRVLSHPKRLLIAAMLKRCDALTGAEIQAALGLSQATVSHHMQALVQSGIVQARPDRKWVQYRLDQRFGRLVP
ncbi:MAG: metalloregulator ArsR/SmtB family transcription factor [Euryarchaeota archaeon]|nr:metalloregulator ArsR/SmtB family transcription factor [Euryarchaeota archaeon]